MPGNRGRHRIARRTLIATGAIGLAFAIGALAVITTAGKPGDASADEADPAFYIDILKVQPNVATPPAAANASTGTFTVDCGRNENGHFNPDNFIAQPGVRNGAQHLHDYVGNLSTNADSTNQSLEAAGTTCKNGDKSAYFWPVVRIDTGDAATNTRAPAQPASRIVCPDVASKLPAVPAQAKAEVDRNLALLTTQIDEADQRLATSQGQGGPNFVQNAILGPLKDKRIATIDRIAIAIGRVTNKPQGLDRLAPCALGRQAGNAGALPGPDADNQLPGNDGKIIEPEQVQITFRGSPAGPVVAMPQFLRILYGDAKESTNGPKNARPSWTCTGFENRITEMYPICPEGSKVKRIHTFPSCWDGRNTDSANHRTHILFPRADGRCPAGFRAVPELRISLTYNIPHDVQVKKQYKVDAFPQEHHNPLSDHDDFANVMSQSIMSKLVDCVNRNRTCTA